jgi:hypothetical protein
MAGQDGNPRFVAQLFQVKFGVRGLPGGQSMVIGENHDHRVQQERVGSYVWGWRERRAPGRDDGHVQAARADLVRSASGHHVYDGDVGVRMAVSQSRQGWWQQVQGSCLERADPQAEREVAEQCGQFGPGPVRCLLHSSAVGGEQRTGRGERCSARATDDQGHLPVTLGLGHLLGDRRGRELECASRRCQ